MQYTLARTYRCQNIQTALVDNAVVDGHDNIHSFIHTLGLDMRCQLCSRTAKLPVLQLWEAD